MMRRAGPAAALCAALLAFPALADAGKPPASGTSSAGAGAAGQKTESGQESAEAFHRKLLERVREDAKAEAERHREREERFRRARDEQAEALQKVQAQVDRAEAESNALDTRYADNEHELDRRDHQLSEHLGQVGELYGVVRLVATDLDSQTWDSLTSMDLGGRKKLLERLGRSKGLPSTEDMERLWYELLREMTEQGRVVSSTAPVLFDGSAAKDRRITRVGPFTAVFDGGYLEWDAEKHSLSTLERQPPPRYLHTVASYLKGASDHGLHLLAVDPSRGQLLDLLTRTPSFIERIEQGGMIGYTILLLGFFALLLGAARFVHLAVVGRRVAAQEARGGRPSDDDPLGRVLRVDEANHHADRDTLELKLDDAVLRETGSLGRYLWIVQSIAVIAPLLGLLGTVTGMIKTFKAITVFGTGDPKTMAGGISEALVTTMLGLYIAVPLVVLYALLSSRVRNITDVLDERVAALIAARVEGGEDEPAADAIQEPLVSTTEEGPTTVPGRAEPTAERAGLAGWLRLVLRFARSAAVGLVATFGLLWLMQALVSVGYQLLPGGQTSSIDFVRLRHNTAPPEEKHERPKREKPQQPPPPPDISRSQTNLNPGQEVVAIAPVANPAAAVATGIGGTGGSDRDVIPLVRTDPEYPAQAAARAITGWVTVKFTVAKTGAVKDPVVIAAQPPRIFNQAALAAVRRWKYNPKIEEGQAVERPNMQITFEFKP